MPIRVSGQGSGRPYIRFSPQSNAWLKAGLDGPDEVDVTTSPLCIDIVNLQLGWMLLGEGVREWQPWPSLTQRTPKPEGDWKIGFSVPVYSKKLLGDDVHDMAANSTASTRFIEGLYNAVEADIEEDKALVIQITGSKPLRIGKGNTREILYDIVKWIPRPAAFDAPGGNGAAKEDDEFDAPKKPAAKRPPSPPPASARPTAKQPARPVEDEADEF